MYEVSGVIDSVYSFFKSEWRFLAGVIVSATFLKYLEALSKGLSELHLAQQMAYENDKGSNQATKEDIEEITQKIESVKTEIWEASHISQYRYDKEYHILRDLNSAVYNFRKSFEKVVMEYDQKELRKEYQGFLRSLEAFMDVYEPLKPFYPREIYNLIKAFDTSCWKKLGTHRVSVHAMTKNEPNVDVLNGVFARLRDESKTIQDSLTEIEEAIRQRVESWEKLDLKQK